VKDDTEAVIAAWRKVVREQHDARVQKILDRLSDREKALVREAAVMGFVQGVMFAGALHKERIPPDAWVLRETLDGIGGMPENFPTLSGWTPEAA
jgi:hypothetical protein